MSYKIVGDSCIDLTADLKKDPHFQIIPLILQVGNTQIIDDDTFDQKKFLELVKNSNECPKTACPSPEFYKEAYEGEEDQIFVITLSEHLSGSYNSAVLGKKLYEEEHGDDGKKIAVLGSDSASSGQLNIALFVQSLCQASLPFEEIEQKAREFIKNMKTYFVLESLDILRKNGRLTGLQAFFATALNIKPVMGADSGVIIKLDQARGIHKALMRMVDIAVREAGDTRDKVLAIAHCNNLERAQFVEQEMRKRAVFKDVIITETAGVATVYASDGGIVMTL
ncbi:DegV family protein [Lacrimispora sp.]|uniref:DegV family protein n=1 Tax=Lacrimispora sp. TaxID=2719234 RepID=UPI003993A3E9